MSTTTTTKTVKSKGGKTTTVQVKKAPKTVQAPTKVAGSSDFFMAMIDPFNAKKGWHLPDSFNGSTAEFKQTSTVSVVPEDPEEIVIIAGVIPSEGMWIKAKNSPDVQSIKARDALQLKIFQESTAAATEIVQKMREFSRGLKVLEDAPESSGSTVLSELKLQAQSHREELARLKKLVVAHQGSMILAEDLPKLADMVLSKRPAYRVHLDEHVKRVHLAKNFDVTKPHAGLRFKLLHELLHAAKGPASERETRLRHSLAVDNAYIWTNSFDLQQVTASANSWWSQSGSQTTAFVASNVRVAPNPIPVTGAPHCEAYDVAGRPYNLTPFANAGVAGGRQVAGVVMQSGNTYTINFDLKLDRVPTSPQIVIFDDAGTAITGGTPDATGGCQITFTAVRDGYWTWEYHSNGGNQNLLNYEVSWTDSDPNVDWTQVPTPDADTISANTTGIRKCTEEFLLTYMGSTLNDGGQVVNAKLPSDYFSQYSPGDISFSTIAGLPTRHDGRLSDGARSIQPPYGAQQSQFLSDDRFPFDDIGIAAPRICIVANAMGQPFRIRQTMCVEGPSTSQLFANYARSGDPTALTRAGAACANMPHDSANFIHLMVISAACAAWKIACNAWPYVESIAKWTLAFSGAMRTANEAARAPMEQADRKRR